MRSLHFLSHCYAELELSTLREEENQTLETLARKWLSVRVPSAARGAPAGRGLHVDMCQACVFVASMKSQLSQREETECLVQVGKWHRCLNRSRRMDTPLPPTSHLGGSALAMRGQVWAVRIPGCPQRGRVLPLLLVSPFRIRHAYTHCVPGHTNRKKLSIIPAHALLNSPNLVTNHTCILTYYGHSLTGFVRKEFGEKWNNQ